MSLRELRMTAWSPTPDDPLHGCNNKTRWLYDLVKSEPGIGQHVAATRMGTTSVQSAVATLVHRDLIEVRQDDRYYNFLWPLERRA